MGEGGALIVSTGQEDFERAEIIREKGTDRSRFLRGQVDKYTWVSYGSSYLPSDLNAAYLYAQLERADVIQSSRRNAWELYDRELRQLESKGYVSLPCVPGGCIHNAHMYYLKCKDFSQRTQLISFLKKRGLARLSIIFRFILLLPE